MEFNAYSIPSCRKFFLCGACMGFSSLHMYSACKKTECSTSKAALNNCTHCQPPRLVMLHVARYYDLVLICPRVSLVAVCFYLQIQPKQVHVPTRRPDTSAGTSTGPAGDEYLSYVQSRAFKLLGGPIHPPFVAGRPSCTMRIKMLSSLSLFFSRSLLRICLHLFRLPS